MTDDKIAEIRERHARDAEWSGGWAQICPRTHDDRATLLAEVERLRKANEAACEGDELLRAAFTRLLDRLTRERDDALAEVDKLRAENARLRAQISEYFAEPATHPVEET